MDIIDSKIRLFPGTGADSEGCADARRLRIRSLHDPMLIHATATRPLLNERAVLGGSWATKHIETLAAQLAPDLGNHAASVDKAAPPTLILPPGAGPLLDGGAVRSRQIAQVQADPTIWIWITEARASNDIPEAISRVLVVPVLIPRPGAEAFPLLHLNSTYDDAGTTGDIKTLVGTRLRHDAIRAE